MNKYDRIRKLYPEHISLDQLYKICQISKRSALYLIQNNIIPSQDTGKKTWRYKISLDHVIAYLRKRDKVGSMIPPGSVSSHCTRPNNPRRSFADIVAAGQESEIAEYFRYIYDGYPEVLTAPEVAEMTGFTKETIFRILRAGEIKSIARLPKYLVPKAYLLEFVTTRRFIEANGNSETFKKILGGYELWRAAKL